MKRLIDNPAVPPTALAALVVVGAAIRFVVLGQDLFADELATYWVVASNNLPDAVETVTTTAEISPPLGFILSWLMTPIGSRLDVDLAPELIRLPALLAGVGSIPLVYAIGVRTAGRGAALLAAALTTLSPFMIFYSAEARGYAVMMLLVLLSTLMLLIAVDRGRARWWAAYAAFACMAAYTHYTVIFVLGAQVVWAFWLYPKSRKPLSIATAAAALLYVPWLPSLKDDLDSPTTVLLDTLVPFDLSSSMIQLGHWTLGFPFSAGAPLEALPGTVALVLIATSILVGVVGMFTARDRLGAWFSARDRRIVLVVLLALATPVGAAVVSLVSNDIFSTRNLAASWPYLALAFAAMITVGDRRVRLAAAALAVAAFGIGAAKMMTTDYARPHFSDVAEFISDGPRGVVVDAATVGGSRLPREDSGPVAVTPGPRTNFEVEGSRPDAEVLRLTAPQQGLEPFNFTSTLVEPSQLALTAVEAAGGEPITVVYSPVGESGATGLAAEFIDHLPPAYRPTERRSFPGYVDLEALVFERRGASETS